MPDGWGTEVGAEQCKSFDLSWLDLLARAWQYNAEATGRTHMRSNRTVLLIVFVTLLALFVPFGASAQTPLFAPSEAPVRVAPPAARSVTSIELGAGAASALAPERAAERIALPVPGGPLVASKTGRVRADDRSVWTGVVEGEEGSLVVLTTRGERTAGVVLTAERTWQIVPQPGGGHVLAELDPDDFRPCGVRGDEVPAAAHDGGPAGGPAAASTVAAAGSGAGTIRVLELYTEETERELGGRANAELLIANSVDLANALFADSGVGSRLELAATARWDGSGSRDLWTVLEALRTAPEVRALRQTHRADLVGLFVGGGGGEYCGVGSLYDGDPELAYHVVSWSCAVGNLSYPHEVGHNLAAHHNPENAFGGADGASRAHYVCGEFRTVMGYPDPCSAQTPRIALFSTPARQHKGKPVGIAGQRDNVAAMNRVVARAGLFAEDTFADTSGCVPGTSTLCLRGGRFELTVQWTDPDGTVRPAKAVPMTDDVGFFWFFRDGNVEVLTKVIDGCAANGAYWAFVTGMTDRGLSVRVRDTRSGLARTYESAPGQAFRPVQDTSAFPTCS